MMRLSWWIIEVLSFIIRQWAFNCCKRKIVSWFSHNASEHQNGKKSLFFTLLHIRNYDTQEKHFNTQQMIVRWDWREREGIKVSMSILHCSLLNMFSVVVGFFCLAQQFFTTIFLVFMSNGPMINETMSCKCGELFIPILKILFCLFFAALSSRNAILWRRNENHFSIIIIILISCGQQPKIIKSCVRQSEKDEFHVHHLQGMNFYAWCNARVFRVYLQLQFKRIHVLLIDLIEIYIWQREFDGICQS